MEEITVFFLEDASKMLELCCRIEVAEICAPTAVDAEFSAGILEVM